jgi:hypothetical protein
MHITASAQIELESFFYYIKYRPPTSRLPQKKRARSERRRKRNHKAKKSGPKEEEKLLEVGATEKINFFMVLTFNKGSQQ